VEPDDGIDDELANRHALPDDLPVNLALGRDVDEEVTMDLGPTAEASFRSEAAELVVLGLIGAPGREVGARRLDPVLREAALAGDDLTAAAQAAPAADGIEVDAERAGGIEDRGSGLEPATPA
jgi:hypothetical protein